MLYGMAVVDPRTVWHDPSWRVSGDNPLQAGLRLQQGWWRQNRAGVDGKGIAEAGLHHPTGSATAQKGGPNPLVVSTLPESCADFGTNLMWPEAVEALRQAKSRLGSSGGILAEDRLRRNLLSSQPLCFNLFGYLGQLSDLSALLPWVKIYAPKASGIERILLEYAPSADELGGMPLGGSAFDAFIEYRLPEAQLGFIGVETKYHEDLSKGLRLPNPGTRPTKYEGATQKAGSWVPGAADALMGHRKNLQFWYNQLLAQRTYALVGGGKTYSQYRQVVVATQVDSSAKAVVDTIRGQLDQDHQDTLWFCSLEDVIAKVEGQEHWKARMAERYTDFTPIQDHLDPHSPLKTS
jgi:hypothetical protein